MASEGDLDQLPWHTPDALLALGCHRSRVVLVNEAHDGDLRCVRTREVGRRLLPVAHAGGVRHLAMEALPNTGPLRAWTAEANVSRRAPPAAAGYLAQPEMCALIQTALDLGWTLHSYEADFSQAPPGDDSAHGRGMAATG